MKTITDEIFIHPSSLIRDSLNWMKPYRNWSESTFNSYLNDVKAFEKYCISQKIEPKLNQIKLHFIQKWIKDQINENISFSTIKRRIASLSSIFQLNKYIDGENNQTTFTYNENELVVFDDQGEKEDLSVTSTYQFDSKENEYKVTVTSGVETVYKRDLKNNTYAVTQIETPGEDEQISITLYTYDAQYNVINVVNSDGSTVSNTYDAKGNLLTTTKDDAATNTTTNTYTNQNQLETSISPNGEQTINIYDGPFLKSTKVNDVETIYEYDEYGRLTKTTYANNSFEKIDYDDEKRKVTTTDKNGNQTSITYSIYMQKLEEVDATEHTKKYTYDPVYQDSIATVTDGNRNTTTYEYDNNNNLTTITDALNHQKKYTYNDNDQVTAVIMPGMTFQYTYDSNGKLSQTILPSGITTNYFYNISDNIEIVENGNETISYQYDENGNNTTVLRNGNPLKIMDYSSENNLLANYKVGLFTQSYIFDDYERKTNSITTYENGLSILQKTVYKENSDEIDHIQYILGEDVIHDYKSENIIEENQSTLTLNDGLLKQVTTKNDANLLLSFNYLSKSLQPVNITYDYTENGNISKVSVNGIESTFEYDKNNQLTKETLPDGTENVYEYDLVGNRTESTVNGKTSKFTYNDDKQIETKNGVSYLYDDDGNITQDENYKYTYNQQQRLTKVETLDDEAIASYTYDENGLRLTKTVGDTTHEYFYNNEILEMEVVNVNKEVKEYRLYEWSGDIPLGMIVKSKDDTGKFETKAYHLITNHRGDVLNIRDTEDKEVGSYRYDVYGNILAVEGEIAKENLVRYAGYYYDEETKNYYLQDRYYNPSNGSFLTLDPDPGVDDDILTQNGYTYANNNPVMLVDSDGKYAFAAVYLVPGVGQAALIATGVAAVAAGAYYGGKAVYKATSNSGKNNKKNNSTSNKGKQKGKEFRGGKKKDRDKWYGYNNKDFQKWWEKKGKKEWGGQDIQNKKMAKEVYDDWVESGKPKVK